MIVRILEIAFGGGFWQFLGTVIILGMILHIPANLIATVWSAWLRYRAIRQHGYPEGCNANGLFAPPPEEDEDNG